MQDKIIKVSIKVNLKIKMWKKMRLSGCFFAENMFIPKNFKNK